MVRKTVLITGASGGIGSATAKIFANNGYNVIVHYNKSKASAEKVLQAISNHGIIIQADLSKKEDIEKLVEKVVSIYGKIDCLVNNAGESHNRLLIDESYDSIKKCFEINTIGPIYLTELIIQNMLKHKEGRVVNISSIYAISGAGEESTYSATKSAFSSWTSALASELGPNGILVNTVAPGAIDTNMNKNFSESAQKEFFKNSAIKRMGRPEEVAEMVYFLASDKASYISGQTFVVSGGINYY